MEQRVAAQEKYLNRILPQNEIPGVFSSLSCPSRFRKRGLKTV